MSLQLGSRVRERKLVVDPTLVLGTQTITVDGMNAGTHTARVNTYGHVMYDFTILEKCWDELHNREEIVQYYIKRPCKRRVYLTNDEAIAYKAMMNRRGLIVDDLYAKVGHSREYISGGPFTLIQSDCRDEYKVKGKDLYRISSGPYTATYQGGFLPTGFSNFGPSKTDMYYGHAMGSWSPIMLQEGLEELGAKAWNKARPRTSSFDLPTAIGELRDFPGMLKKTAKGFHDLWRGIGGSLKTSSIKNAPKEVSEHFLNHAFGWAPFVGDLMKIHDVYQNSDTLIKQMIADNGKWVRRRRRVDETVSMKNVIKQDTNVAWVYPTLHDWLYSPKGNKYGETTTFVEEYLQRWFVGSFRYYIPRPPDDSEHATYNRVMDMLRLYGVNLNPSTIWNLTPWSWLADYFGNVGDIIDNLSAQNNDNLTARYAFLMQRNRSRYVNDSTVYTCKGDVRMTWAREIGAKTRIEAQPFGFGLTGGGLNSAYRYAILGALGLSRSRVARR